VESELGKGARFYAKLTAQMTTRQIRDYIIDYQNYLQTAVMKGEEGAQAFEPFAGDASITTFEDRPGDDGKKKNTRCIAILST
jgi:hypothetical protein